MPCPKSIASLETALIKARNDQTQDRLEDAYKKVQEIKKSGQKPNISQIALEFDVPRATLNHCVNGRPSKQEDGVKHHLLPPKAENALVEFLVETACRGFPETEERVREIATIIHRNLTDDEKTHVGKTWVNCFLKRNSDKPKKSWATSQSMLRGTAANKESVDPFFELLSRMITVFSIVPELLLAMDESNTFIDKSTRRFKVIGIAKKRAQASLKNENRESVTLIPLISAAVLCYPPTIIFKGMQIRGKNNLPNPLGAK